jgi:ribosomal protein L15
MGSVDTEVDSPSSNDDDPTLLTDPSPGRTRKPKLGPKTRSVQLRGHAGAENRSYKQSPQVTFAGGPDFVSSSPKNGESPFADERDAVASSTLVMAWDGGKSEPLTSEQRQEEHHKKCRLDMDTGRHILRCQSVLQLSGNRQAGECRWRHWLKENFLRGGKAGSEAVTGNAASLPDPADSRCGGASVCSDSEEQRTRRVYRVRSLYQFHHSSQQELVSGSNVSLLSDYIRWTFRASFFQVTLASYVEFLGLIIMFALFIWAVGIYQPECIFGGEFTSDLAPSFVDA